MRNLRSCRIRLISIGEAVDQLGMAVGTLLCWHRQGRLAPVGRTVGGYRRYPASKGQVWRVTAWRGVYAAYRGVVREHSLAAPECERYPW